MYTHATTTTIKNIQDFITCRKCCCVCWLQSFTPPLPRRPVLPLFLWISFVSFRNLCKWDLLCLPPCLSLVSLGLIHVIGHATHRCLCITEEYSVIWKYRNLLVHASIDGTLGCFGFMLWGVKPWSFASFCVHTFSSLLDKYLGKELLSCIVTTSLTL